MGLMYYSWRAVGSGSDSYIQTVGCGQCGLDRRGGRRSGGEPVIISIKFV